MTDTQKPKVKILQRRGARSLLRQTRMDRALAHGGRTAMRTLPSVDGATPLTKKELTMTKPLSAGAWWEPAWRSEAGASRAMSCSWPWSIRTGEPLAGGGWSARRRGRLRPRAAPRLRPRQLPQSTAAASIEPGYPPVARSSSVLLPVVQTLHLRSRLKLLPTMGDCAGRRTHCSEAMSKIICVSVVLEMVPTSRAAMRPLRPRRGWRFSRQRLCRRLSHRSGSRLPTSVRLWSCKRCG
jgi:hypothetical protein